VVRPTVGRNVWLSILASLALLAWGLSSPIGFAQAADACVDAASPPGAFVHAFDGPGEFLSSPPSERASLDATSSDFIDEDEAKSPFSFPPLASPTFIASPRPSKALPGPLPGVAAPWTVAVPLRC